MDIEEIVVPNVDDPDTRWRVFQSLSRLHDGMNAHDAGIYALEVAYLAKGAPEPVAPSAVGDTIETAAQLDALPVGTVVRVLDEGRIVLHRHDDGWRYGDEMVDDREIRRIVTEYGARVLDLGGES